jgi:hypothetical protein
VRPAEAANLLRRHFVFWICLLAVAAASTSIGNGFALDDVHLIPANDRVHAISEAWKLFGQTYWPPAHGSSLYRPLTMLMFSMEWAIGGGSPMPFHVMNIVLYAVTCVMLFRFLRQLVDTDVAWLGAALFAVHPVHTEAVANVVGQAELLAAIFVFASMERYIRARRNGSLTLRDTAIIAGFYACGLLSKEHAVVLPALLVCSEVVIRKDETLVTRAKKFLPALVALAAVAVAFIIIRTRVTGGLRSAGVNEILSGEPFFTRALTMLSVVLEWIRLLLWPAQLSADYSFPRTHVYTSFDASMVPGVIVLLGSGVIAWALRRTIPVVTFAILWFAVTMAIPSNLVMMTGFVLAERTLFLPSVTVVLILAVAIAGLWRMIEPSEDGRRRILAGAVGLVLIAGVTRSVYRNPAWHDNDTLFRQTVEDTPFSSRAHWMLAEHLTKLNNRKEAAEEMMLAVALGRKDDFILLGFAADQLNVSGMCGRAMPLYRRALGLTPQNEQLRANAALCLMKLGRIQEARDLAAAGFELNRASAVLNKSVAVADSLTRLRGASNRSLPQ